MDLITLYNQQREKVGETYPRRAKQLVRNGRATWLEESVALQLKMESPPIASIKEEKTMTDEDMYPTNGSPRTDIHPLDYTEDDDLLMYIARKNVQDKRNLTRHLAGFIAASLALFILFGISASGSHRLARTAQWHRNTTDTIIMSPDFETFRYETEIWDIYHFLHAVTNLVHPIWVFTLGLMVAWGGWILTRLAKCVVGKLRKRDANRPKPDPVAVEYKRLKSLSTK